MYVLYSFEVKTSLTYFQKYLSSVFNYSIEGYYIYHECDNVSNGKKARLLSPLISSTATQICIQFRYYMYGADTYNLLRVLTRKPSGEEEIWKKTGIVSPSWQLGSVTVSNTTSEQITVSMCSSIQVYLEAGLTSYSSK